MARPFTKEQHDKDDRIESDRRAPARELPDHM